MMISPSTARRTTVCFTVTGQALAEMARNLLLDDEPGQAFRLISNGLIGEGATAAAISILRGERDLVGNSHEGLRLIKAKKCKALTRFLADARYIYAGRIKRRGVWLQPVAWLTHLTSVDGDWAAKHARVGSDAWQHWRARYYADTNGEAEALDLPGEGRVWVLFEVCSERPYWDPPPLDAQAALNEALAAGRRLERQEPISPDPVPSLRMRESEEEEKRRERDAERREAEWEEKIKKVGEDVRAQAADDTFEMELEDGRKLKIPRAPFVRWALCRTELMDSAPEWKNVATSGFKMPMDNPDHTDWVLGAGLTFEEAYKDVVSNPAWTLAFQMQEDAREAQKPKRPFAGIFAAIEQLHSSRHAAAVIVDAGECTGVVGVDIAVLPDSQAHRVGDVLKCKGVIVEEGGPLAHLVIVARGQEITVMRYPGACVRFQPGMCVSLNPSTGRITLLNEPPADPA